MVGFKGGIIQLLKLCDQKPVVLSPCFSSISLSLAPFLALSPRGSKRTASPSGACASRLRSAEKRKFLSTEAPAEALGSRFIGPERLMPAGTVSSK